MFYRIRIIEANGRIFLRDFGFSQVVEMIRDLNSEARDAFWAKKETLLSDGRSLKFVREG